MAMSRPGFIVVMTTEAASASHSATVTFDAGDTIAGSRALDSCTMSRKYVINSPRT